MNASQTNRLSGFRALLSSNGEALTFGRPAATANGLVNRAVAKVRDGVASRDGQLDFEVLGMTELEFAIGDVPQPKASTTYFDSLGFRHRVVYVAMTDITWVLYCLPTQTSAT